MEVGRRKWGGVWGGRGKQEVGRGGDERTWGREVEEKEVGREDDQVG